MNALTLAQEIIDGRKESSGRYICSGTGAFERADRAGRFCEK